MEEGGAARGAAGVAGEGGVVCFMFILEKNIKIFFYFYIFFVKYLYMFYYYF